MSNKRPDELPSVSSITSGDILIAEINPDNGGTRRVVKITKENLLSDINDGGLSGLLNAGAGSGLVSGIASQVGYIKSLSAGTNIQISGDESTLYFNVTGVGGGGDGSGVTSFTNLGAGSGIASGVDGTTGYFKTLVGGTNLQITGDDESLYLNVTGISGGSGSGITSFTNLGAGSGIASGVDGTTGYFKTLAGGTNLQITGDDSTLYLNVTGISGDGSGVGGASNIGPGTGIISGVSNKDIKVKSLLGGTNVSLSSNDNSITINAAGGGGGGGGETSAFAFFSNAINNGGIIEKTYYPTVTPNTYLSGIDVDNASDITLYLRWDGPHDGYMGTGFINGQQIPTGNISQLGTATRRFEGYIENLNLA